MYKINKLLKLDEKLWHTNDLALLWNTTNRNTLYTGIKRYVEKGILIPVHKGLYSTVPLAQLDPVKLGVSILHNYCYVSTESILARNGIISQVVYAITFVSSVSRKFSIAGGEYVSRRMSPRFLYQTAGIKIENGILMATVSRAVADMLYFDPHYHFDADDTIDWDQVKQIQREVGFT